MIKTRKSRWGLFLLILGFFILGFGPWNRGFTKEAADSPSPSLHLTVSPGTTIKQGMILLVTLKTPGKLPEGTFTQFEGHHSPFFEQSAGVYQALLGISVDTPPGSHTIPVLTGGGKTLASETITILDAHFPKQNIQVGKSTAGLKPLPGELEAIQSLKEAMSSVRYWSQPLMSPTPDCENSPFGVKRYHNGVYIHDYHKGVDLRSPQGRPIQAIADGVVKIAKPFRLHGGTIGLDHGQGLSSVYIHMSKLAVHEGEHVKKGQTVGYVGSTGFATGPHLHWSLYANGTPVNPDQWIPVRHCS